VQGVGHLINIGNSAIFNNYAIGFLKDMLHDLGG